ncbi:MULTISPECIES: DUF4192 domain-containing protein [unclassified Streptomyces]|uniref:DUF4192 domain-containing protein n=1 Tax=unclassified Streptomyces TaxID=2593676 RepID=UPI0006FBB361|nr:MULTISPECIES: DUF4192 domain-containing protein [unclassified Streptomyces]KQX56188.1 hypothetical protein ASD33_29465 [Streptomyces sp. Root1304]KRA97004.1 hypothetical protein ASE09_26275 [Streptomyces sp. Root66D1]
MNANHHETSGPSRSQQITLRGPAELADALPFVLGFHPTDSVVLVALHGERGRFGGRVRLGIPGSPGEWESTADHLAECLVEGDARSGARPDGIVVFLCQDPAPGESGRRVMERLRPFAQRLRTACGALDIPVYEALCISDGLYFSYCCPDARCCPPDGTPLALSGTSVMAAAATYAGVQVRGTLRDMENRFKPSAGPGEEPQRAALDATAAAIVPRILEAEGEGREEIRETTIRLAREILRRFTNPKSGTGAKGEPGPTGPVAAGSTAERDRADDALIGTDEAAALILGLQDRVTRDRAAEWMEGWEGTAALRLWRVLARRCVTPYQEHAAAPLTLAGWVAWSTGDEPTARVALGLALDADSEYMFARLLHQACNEGLDPESLRSCLRTERDSRTAPEEAGPSAARRPRMRTDRPQGTRQALGKPGLRTGGERPPAAGVRPGGPAAGRPGGGAPRPGGPRGSRTGRCRP